MAIEGAAPAPDALCGGHHLERRVDPQIGCTPRPGNPLATTSAAPMMRGQSVVRR